MTSHELLAPEQFGFRKGMSTEHAIHSVVKAVHTSLNSGKYSMGIFMDIQKAFDSLDRDILLDKLTFYGILDTELQWFRSYLTNRRQYVKYNNFDSSLKRVNYGVPQGSAVSPVLFLIYINDIVECFHGSKCVLYADDTSVFVESDDISELYTLGNEAVSSYNFWFVANRLTVNKSKTLHVIFRRKQKRVPAHSNILRLDDATIRMVENIRFLGVLLDQHLSWNEQISNIARKLAKYVPIMYASRHHCSDKCIRLIYNCLIYSNLIYCNSIWGYCTKAALRPLHIIQKKILRGMAGVSLYAPSRPIFASFSLLTLDDINIYITALFVYKCLHSIEFRDWFRERSHSYPTRFDETLPLTVPRIANKHSEQCISYRGPVIWNELPVDIREQTYNCFKIRLKRLLFSRQNPDR